MVGGAIGAAVAIIVLVVVNTIVPGRIIDATNANLIIPAFVLLGTLMLANTNNSIDSRVTATLDRYERDYKAEIARNQQERQVAMEKSAEIMQTQVLSTMSKLQKNESVFMLRMFALLVMLAVVFLLGQRDTVLWLRKLLTRLRRTFT